MTIESNILRMSLIVLVAALAMLTAPALATNTPCSKKKGGIVGCVGTKFLCRDGSTSASKKTCTRGQAGLDGASDDEGEVVQFRTEDGELTPPK
jgi:hypothetical protein